MSLSPSPSPFGQPSAPGGSIPELVVGSILVVAGLWSVVKWIRTEFLAESARDRVLYALHVTARAGTWFAFAGFFIGLAFVDEPTGFTWFLLIPLSLAGVQLITSVVLGQGQRHGNGSVR